MQTVTRLVVLFVLVSFGSGCIFGKDESKADARREIKEGSTADFCGIYDWYGDGECDDDICLELDPDCESTCKALPSCDVDEVNVPNCTGFEICEVRELCDTTIFCAVETDNCQAIPMCDPGYDEVLECDANAECEELSLCGVTIFCQRDIDVCETEDPVCPPDTSIVEQCEPNATCEAIPWCDTTVLCQQPFCEDRPQCPDGYAFVQTCDDADVPCTEFSVCGRVISCERPDDCMAPPTCLENYINAGPSCPAGSANCYLEGGECGTIACLLDSEECNARPSCPTGLRETGDCPADASCFQITVCGQTINCTDV